MQNYYHNVPTKLYFGKGQICNLSGSLDEYGKNVLLVYGGGSLKKTGLYDEVMKILKEGGFRVTECAGVEPNPRIETVRRGVDLCKNNSIDVVLAVGGGSTIDCSKAIAAGVYYDGDLWQMIREYKTIGVPALPLVDILTVSATGSEFDGVAVISNPETKEKLAARFNYPNVSICDPTYTFTVSAYQTAAGSIDIMSHIMEGYFAREADSDLSEGIAETILKSVIKNLPIALKEPDNYSARANLMANASLACSKIPEYGKEDTGWPCHGMEHELSAYYDVTHGVGLAILTPRWMRHILKKDPSCSWRFAKFARNVWGLEGGDELPLAEAGINALEEFFRASGVPMSLTELGIPEDHFEEMAKHASGGGRFAKSFVPLEPEDVVEIFKASL